MSRLFTRDEVKPRNSMDYTFALKGMIYLYTIDNGNLHIAESHSISKKDFTEVFDLLKKRHPHSPIWNRSDASLRREWATHNFCYALNYKREQTADVDLNYPLSKWEKLGYGIVGTIALLFIK